jgi:hypothetical protein
MKKIATAGNVIEAGQISALLENAGISVLVKNHFLSGALGELPPTLLWPEIWLLDERDATCAREILDAFNLSDTVAGDWCCEACGESQPSNFEVCWCCGAPCASVTP